jgi:hypothetical protein
MEMIVRNQQGQFLYFQFDTWKEGTEVVGKYVDLTSPEVVVAFGDEVKETQKE